MEMKKTTIQFLIERVNNTKKIISDSEYTCISRQTANYTYIAERYDSDREPYAYKITRISKDELNRNRLTIEISWFDALMNY